MRPRTLIAIIACLAVTAAQATSEYKYGKHEYVIIHDGLAPNGQLSIAAHGAGEDGNEDFHVWLMTEPSHKRLGVLENVSDKDEGVDRPYLDSGPDAYVAVWSRDSRHVAVWFRTNRHMMRLNLYAVDGRRAQLIRGPSLFHEVMGLDVKDDDRDLHDYRRRIFELSWRSTSRFAFSERRLFQTSDPAFAGRLGRYGKQLTSKKVHDFLVEFSAEADCRLMPGLHYRIVDLKVGKFEEGEP